MQHSINMQRDNEEAECPGVAEMGGGKIRENESKRIGPRGECLTPVRGERNSLAMRSVRAGIVLQCRCR